MNWNSVSSLPIIRMKKSTTLICFLFFLAVSMRSQQYHFENISVGEGLSQASVKTIIEDKNGHLWIGTDNNGLNLYDGTQFKYYHQSNGLPDENITTLFEDSKGKIWIGTENGGACYIENEIIKVFDISNGLSDNCITSICEDNLGNIYIGTKYNGLNILHEKSIQSFFRKDGLFSDAIFDLTKDKEGNIWIATQNGLNYIHSKTKKIIGIEILKDLKINSLLKDYQNKIWVGTNNGVWIQKENSFKMVIDTSMIHTKTINCLFQDFTHNLWIATNKGAYRIRHNNFEEDEVRITLISKENGLSNNQIRGIEQDKSGALWFATKFGGINKYLGETFSIINSNSGLNDPIITAICVLPDSSVVLGTQSNGVVIRKRKKISSLNNSEVLNSTTITALCSDSSGTLWIGTEGNGIYRYENNRLVNFNNITANEVNCFYVDKKGIIWVGTNNHGIKSIGFDNKKTALFYDYENPENIENCSVYSICEDDQGNIWAASNKGVIQITNTANASKEKLKINVFSKCTEGSLLHVISCYSEIDKQRIWFGTQGDGVYFMHKGKFYTLPSHKSLKNIVINSIYANDNAIWLATDKDVKKISMNTFEIFSYGIKEGFEGIQCNRNAWCIDSKESLWLGTINGACKIKTLNPSQTPENFIPKLDFTNIKFNYSDFDWRPYCDSLTGYYHTPNKLILPYNINHLTFEFKANALINPTAVEYRFQLKGHDNELSPSGSLNKVTYSNIEPGEYTLEVYTKLNGGKWSKKPLSINITIIPPFWETWWFRILLIISIGLVLWIGFKWRIKRLTKEKLQLEDIVQSRTKDLEIEKKKSEELLLNILPEEIATELKDSGTAKTKLYEDASIMFTDFKGFTSLSETLSPDVLVSELNNIFIEFDAITDQHNLEKIKTIGDAYMCAGGIPVSNKTHAVDCVLAGLAFIDFIASFETKIGHSWEVRVGIHSGPLIAGVVGKKKFAYDIWGDSVNVASRMESNSIPGKLNISESTYLEIKEYFICNARGDIHVKNKGEMSMYFVERLLPQYSKDEHGKIANELLYQNVVKKESQKA